MSCRAGRRPRGDLPRGAGRLQLASRDDARRRDAAGAVPGRPRHDGGPDLAVLVPRVPQADGQALSVLHPRVVLSAARRVRPVLPVGRRPDRGNPLRAACPPGRARRRGIRHHGAATWRRHRDIPRASPGARHRDAATRTHRRTRARRSDDPHRRLPDPQSGAAGSVVDHDHRQRTERRRGLPRPARGHRLAWLRADLGHAVAALLPDGVHQADARDDVAGVHGVLPRAPDGDPRRAPARTAAALQGHQQRPDRHDLRHALSQAGARRSAHAPAHQHRALGRGMGRGQGCVRPRAPAHRARRALQPGGRGAGPCDGLPPARTGIRRTHHGPHPLGRAGPVCRGGRLHDRRQRGDLRAERRGAHARPGGA